MAWLVSTDLRNADARQANLTNADLSSADLTGADLSQANLTNAVFPSATLTGANLSGADVTGTSFHRDIVVIGCAPGTPFCQPQIVRTGGISPAQLAQTGNYLAHDLSGIGLSGNELTGANL